MVHLRCERSPVSDHIYLAHHGIKGMRCGVRRYRNKDGSLTEAGKRRYADFASRHNAAVVSEKHYGADAKTLAYMAKRLNSAYYDSEDDDLVIDALGAPLSTIDDPELVELVAQQLEAL